MPTDPPPRRFVRRPRRREIDLGTTRAVKLGTPSALEDVYYVAMDMRWPTFIGAVSAVFLAINIVFALVYLALPGAIDNARPDVPTDAFFFSVETLATVGYGNMAPATTAAHTVATLEILTGLFFTATVTGLIFARFSRPRDALVFSNVAVIGTFETGRALMIRMASVRTRAIADVSAQLGMLQRVTLPDGRSFGRMIDLPLVRPRNSMLSLSWTIAHPLDDNSPVLAALAGDEPILLSVMVSGIDTLLASQTFGRRSYRRDDIVADHDFVDMLVDRDGVLHLDLAQLSTTRPCAG